MTTALSLAFLMPCHPMNIRKVDPAYEDEYAMLKAEGHTVHLVDIDNLVDAKIIPSLEGASICYRGWMLTPEDYAVLYDKVPMLLTTPSQYRASHYLVGWLDEIKDLTFETLITTEEGVLSDFQQSGWTSVFVKDFVKSLKTKKGSIVSSVEELTEVLNEMRRVRTRIEGGIALRKVYTVDTASETRFFVREGTVYSPKHASEDMQEMVAEVAKRHAAPFYSVDVIHTVEGLKVVEIGDGQVSDHVGWELSEFVKIWAPDTLEK